MIGLPLIVILGIMSPSDIGYLTTHDAADRLGIKPRSVVQLIRRNIIAAVKHGRDYAIDEAEIERYERERRPAHRPQKPRE